MADKKSREENYEFITEEDHRKDKHSSLSIKVDLDVSDALKGLKAVQRETRNTNKALRELESQQRKNKHLVIEVDQLGDVPKVYYKGEEVTKKEKVKFEWDTASNEYPISRTEIDIDYFEFDGFGSVDKKSIHEVKGHRSKRVCPKCNSDSIDIVELRTGGTEKPIEQFKVCTKCESDIDD